MYEVKRVHMDGATFNAVVYGFDPIPAGGATVTNELVDELREELGI